MNLKRQEIVDIFQRLQSGINFIEFIKGNVDTYPCYKELLETNIEFQKQNLKAIITKYCNILDAYSDAFISNDVNRKNICQVGRQLLKLAEVDMLPEKLQIIVKLYQADNINHALRLAAAKGNLDHVKYLAKYADINEQGGTSKRTALHWTAEKGLKEIMQVLCDHGADKDLKDKDNKTAEQLTATSSAENKK